MRILRWIRDGFGLLIFILLWGSILLQLTGIMPGGHPAYLMFE